jgi:hypothetical protein
MLRVVVVVPCNKTALRVVVWVAVVMGMATAIHKVKRLVLQTPVVVVVEVTTVVPMGLLADLVLWFYQVRLPVHKAPTPSPSTLAQAKPRWVALFPMSRP